MLRRIINRLPSNLFLNSKKFYLFSEGDKQDSNNYQKPDKSLAFERKILSYTHKIWKQKQQLQRRSQMHSSAQDNTANQEKTQQRRRRSNPNNDRYGLGIDMQKTNKYLFYAIGIILGFYLLKGSGQKTVLPSDITNHSKMMSESQMIAFLSSGAANDNVFIIRQTLMQYKRENQLGNAKRVYQTLCVANEKNKAEVLVGCLILNLPSFLQKLEAIPLPYKIEFVYNAEQSFKPEPLIKFGTIVAAGLIGFLMFSLYKSSKMAKSDLSDLIGANKFEPIKPEHIQTYFKDVAGMHEAKQEITEFVDFLKNPDKYIQMGAKIPKGALLTGPPGTGKTLLARACAGEAGVPFFYVSGSEFVEKYVGLGASRVRSLFQTAGKAAPSIIFIDQIDAIGKKRNSGPFSNEEKENTLNQLLVNMDGFDTKNKIIVMAATNLKDSLDPALLRPGRFDRSVEITLPNFEERVQILKVHLSKVKFSEKFTIEELGKKISVLTPGFSGAQLANICNEAAILAARDGKASIQLPQFQKATERVMAGLQKRNLFSEEEKECLAYYECGRAVVSWFTEGADPVIKISIAAYSKSGKGYSHEIKDEMPLRTRQELMSKAMCYLAGRTAEKRFKGYITNNGDVDLKKAKRIITFMVAKLGMSSVIGKIGYPNVEYVRKPYSDETESRIDKEVDRLYRECQAQAEKIVEEKAEMIEKLKGLILEKETLMHNTLKEVLGDRPFKDTQNYEKFLKDSEAVAVQKQEQVTITPPAPQ